jgi:release factor glutamine methyltransferase
MTVKEAIIESTKRLKKAGIEDARAEAESLLEHAANREVGFFSVHPEQRLSPEVLRRFRGFFAKRAKREPFAYIVGEKWFYGRSFFVNKYVLIPRPATEALVEIALEFCQMSDVKCQVLDMGCGSGAIGLTLAAELPRARVTCADISPEALTVARKNAKRFGLSRRVTFLPFDIRKPSPRGPSPEIVVANLPYLPERVWKKSAPEVRDHEPRLALASGPDGLDHYRALMKRLDERQLKPKLLLLEAEPYQMRTLKKIVRAALPTHHLEIKKDLALQDRILVARSSS